MRDLRCSICNAAAEIKPMTFLKNDKLWHIDVIVCTNEPCMIKRGGWAVEHRVEKRGNMLFNVPDEGHGPGNVPLAAEAT
jgi:hypothetical protein